MCVSSSLLPSAPQGIVSGCAGGGARSVQNSERDMGPEEARGARARLTQRAQVELITRGPH
eukprot:2850187-Pyramimonas_sp.AAC.1